MFCPNCSKLAILFGKRICVRCNGYILNNISCICELCAKQQNICSVCLKKLLINQHGLKRKVPKTGCKSCGK